MFARIPGVTCTCFSCIVHMLLMGPKHFLDVSFVWKKRRSSYLNLAATLSRGFALAQILVVCIPDSSHACPRRVLHMFQTRLEHIPDACECELGAELYSSWTNKQIRFNESQQKKINYTQEERVNRDTNGSRSDKKYKQKYKTCRTTKIQCWANLCKWNFLR